MDFLWNGPFWIDFSRPRLQDPNIEFLTYFGFGFFNAEANANDKRAGKIFYIFIEMDCVESIIMIFEI